MLSALPQDDPPGTGTDGDPVRDVSLSTFMAEVIEASKNYPVVVDFWAPWCGPCKQLGPTLEKCIRALKGAVRLAKIDIDKNPQIAQQMGVQSIPAVFAFFRGQPVDGFMGALPEAQVKVWLERLVKMAGGGMPASDGVDEALKQAADLLLAKGVAGAQAIYGELLEMDPLNATAYAGLLRCLIASGETAQARDMLSNAPPEIAKDKAFEAVRAALELVEEAVVDSDVLAGFRARLQKDPADHQARFDLATAHFAAGQHEEAVEQLLEIVRRARTWNDDAARKQLVKFFEALGPADPLTVAGRKRLSSILFA